MKVGFCGSVLKSMLSFEDLRIQLSDFTLLALTKIIIFFFISSYLYNNNNNK